MTTMSSRAGRRDVFSARCVYAQRGIAGMIAMSPGRGCWSLPWRTTVTRVALLLAATELLAACGSGEPARSGRDGQVITAAQFGQLRTGMTVAQVRAVIGNDCKDEYDVAADGRQVLGVITCSNENSAVFIVFDPSGVATQVNSAGSLP